MPTLRTCLPASSGSSAANLLFDFRGASAGRSQARGRPRVGNQTARRIVYDGWCRNVREHAAAGGPVGASGVESQVSTSSLNEQPGSGTGHAARRLSSQARTAAMPSRRYALITPSRRGQIRPADAGQHRQPDHPARTVGHRRRRLEGRNAGDPRRIRGETALHPRHPPGRPRRPQAGRRRDRRVLRRLRHDQPQRLRLRQQVRSRPRPSRRATSRR